MTTPAATCRRTVKEPEGSLLLFFADATTGVLTYLVILLVTVAVVREAPPGFWLVGPAAFFMAGFARGSGNRIQWARSVRITLGSWCAMLYFLTAFESFPSAAQWRAVLPSMLMAFVSPVCGIVSRCLFVRLFC
jgi:hypothetical protein